MKRIRRRPIRIRAVAEVLGLEVVVPLLVQMQRILFALKNASIQRRMEPIVVLVMSLVGPGERVRAVNAAAARRW